MPQPTLICLCLVFPCITHHFEWYWKCIFGYQDHDGMIWVKVTSGSLSTSGALSDPVLFDIEMGCNSGLQLFCLKFWVQLYVLGCSIYTHSVCRKFHLYIHVHQCANNEWNVCPSISWGREGGKENNSKFTTLTSWHQRLAYVSKGLPGQLAGFSRH